MSSIYIVRVGETIRDVIINATGVLNNTTVALTNWNLVCQANGFTTWTPKLLAGQQVIIPDGVSIDTNGVAQFSSYPVNNSSIPGFLNILQTVWDLLSDRWILKTGSWDDTGIWIDSDNWIDN